MDAKNLVDGKSTLVKVMLWCHQQAISVHYQCRSRSMSPYVVIRPQWVKACLQLVWTVTILFTINKTYPFNIRYSAYRGYWAIPERSAIDYTFQWMCTRFVLCCDSLCPLLRSSSHIDGLVQERRNSIANALELRLSCTSPSTYPWALLHWHWQTSITTAPVSVKQTWRNVAPVRFEWNSR